MEMTNLLLSDLVNNETFGGLKEIKVLMGYIVSHLGMADTRNDFLIALERNASTTDEDGNLPLHNACQLNLTLPLIRCIAEKNLGALTTTGNNEKTPLHYACDCGDQPQVGVVEYLVELRPEASGMEDENQKTPIHHLLDNLQYYHDETVPFVIEHNPEATLVPNSNGDYVLSYACQAYNQFNNNRGTPVLKILHCVIENSPLEAFLRLDTEGQSVYDLAARPRGREELRFLAKAMEEAAKKLLKVFGFDLKVRMDFPELVEDRSIRNFLLGMNIFNKRGRSDSTNKVQDVDVLKSLIDYPDFIFLHCRERVQGLFCLPSDTDVPFLPSGRVEHELDMEAQGTDNDGNPSCSKRRRSA
jgi:hypothetical protein